MDVKTNLISDKNLHMSVTLKVHESDQMRSIWIHTLNGIIHIWLDKKNNEITLYNEKDIAKHVTDVVK